MPTGMQLLDLPKTENEMFRRTPGLFDLHEKQLHVSGIQ